MSNEATNKIQVSKLLITGYGSIYSHAFLDGVSEKMDRYFKKKNVTSSTVFNGPVKPGTVLDPRDTSFAHFDASIVFCPMDSSKVKLRYYDKNGSSVNHTMENTRVFPVRIGKPTIPVPAGFTEQYPTRYQQQFAVYAFTPARPDSAIWQCNLIIDFNLKDGEYYKEISYYICSTLSKSYFIYDNSNGKKRRVVK